MHDDFLLVGFYDLVGETVVSYQVYNSKGDFLRSIVRAAHDTTLPFSQFPYDYSVIITGSLKRDDCYVYRAFEETGYSFNYTFADIIKASKGMDPNINFNTVAFLDNLRNLSKLDSDEVVDNA